MNMTDQVDTENTRKLLEVYGRYFGCDINICREQMESLQRQNTGKSKHQ